MIRLGWKGLLGTNTLAYYENSQIMDRKSFITLGPVVEVLKLFYSSMTFQKYKLERFVIGKTEGQSW
jgi:hypothetical protein